MRAFITGCSAALLVLYAAGVAVPARAGAAPLPPVNEQRRAATQADGLLSAADRAAYRHAFEAARDSDWKELDHRLAKIGDTRLFPVLEWLRIRGDGAKNRDEIRTFLHRHPDFPGLLPVRVALEQLIADKAGTSEALDYFAHNPPLTSEGIVRYALLLDAEGDRIPAVRTARRAWRDYNLGGKLEDRILDAFGPALTADDHWQRMDRLLWGGQSSAARRLKGKVDAAHWRLAEARMKLHYRRRGAEAAYRKVPDALKADPGLRYEWVRYLRRSGRDEAAQQYLAGTGVVKNGDPRWWLERRIQIRNLIKNRDFDTAYRIARDHEMDGGLDFARLEFEAGWLALTFLDRPEAALEHFRTLYEGVGSPISRARGAYWTAMAHLALGNDRDAREYLELAALQANTYYGQLAGLRLGRKTLELPAPEPADPARIDAFAARPQVVMARLLAEVGEHTLARTMLSHVMDGVTAPADLVAAARFADRTGLADLQVLLGKAALAAGADVMQTAYPVHEELAGNGFVEPALAHAIARQESTFNVEAVSRAGARGLMQLMPATARKQAGEVQLAYTPARLTRDAAYNATLGSAYLAGLIERFDGYLPMAIAAYNAGPDRVNQWIEDYGDPRTGAVDPVDWIEMLPYSETRNYVQRVLEGLQVYRVRLSTGRAAANRLGQDLGLPGKVAVCGTASAGGAC